MVDLLSFHLHRHWIYLLQNCFLPNIWDSPSRQESSQPFLRPAESMVYLLGCDTLPLPGSPIIWVLWRNCKDWDTKVLSDVERLSHPTSTSENLFPQVKKTSTDSPFLDLCPLQNLFQAGTLQWEERTEHRQKLTPFLLFFWNIMAIHYCLLLLFCNKRGEYLWLS